MSKSLSRKSGVSGISGISLGSIYEEDPPSFLPLRKVGGHKFRISKQPMAYGSSGIIYRAKSRASLTRRGTNATRMVIKILGVDDGKGELKKKEIERIHAQARIYDDDRPRTVENDNENDDDGNRGPPRRKGEIDDEIEVKLDSEVGGGNEDGVEGSAGELASFTKEQLRSKTVEDFLEELTPLDAIEAEIEIMVDLQGSPFIVDLRDAFILERERTFSLCFVVMESLKYSLVDFYDGLETHGRLDRMVLETIFRSVLLGLAFIHRNNIAHCDIKLDTVLVAANGMIKISDFGIAKSLGDGRIIKEGDTKGTPEYMAPEMLSVPEEVPWYDESVDIWALGVILFCLVQGRFPFDEHFQSVHWMYYKQSNDLYFGKALTVELVRDEALFERLCDAESPSTEVENKEDGDPRSRSLRYKSIYNVIRSCMVPYPQSGIKGTPLEIKRKDVLDRATAEDLIQSEEFRAANKRTDITSRNVVKQAIQNFIIGKPSTDDRSPKHPAI